MTKDEAVALYGSQDKLAKALGIRREAVVQWTSVPPLRQLQLEMLTLGRLRADDSARPKSLQAAPQ